MEKPIQILLLEDTDTDAELIRHELQKSNIDHTLTHVKTKDSFLRSIDKNPPHLILSDCKIPGFDGLSAFEISRKKCPAAPFIIISETIGEELAVQAMKAGVTDYILKDRLGRLVGAVEHAFREAEEHMELIRAQERFSKIFWGSPAPMCLSLLEEGRLIDVNERCVEFFGYSREEMIGRKVQDLGLWVDITAKNQAIKELAEKGTLHNFEAEFRRKSGEIRYALISMETIKLPSFDEPVLAVMFNDIT